MSTTTPFQSNSPYFRPFALADIGVDTDVFLEHIQPVYDSLRWDLYDTVRGSEAQPTRQRGIAEFRYIRTGNDWSIIRTEAKPYQQATDHGSYDRTSPRTYPEVEQSVTDHPAVVRLQKAVADMVLMQQPDAVHQRSIVTFVRAVDEEGRSGHCAPEGGTHSDGMDYIVSALVINRHNLETESGQSAVLLPDGTELYREVLQPGEGVFMDDKNLLHDITNIRRSVRAEPGMRDMLGIDIQIISP